MSLGRYIATQAAIGAAFDLAPPIVGHAIDAVDLGQRANRAVRAVHRGASYTRAVAGRGRAPTTMVAGEFFHGPGDRKAAIAQLTSDFAAFQNDLATNAVKPDDARWALDAVLPILTEWHAFAIKVAGSELAPWMTEWSTLEQWQERLVRLRELALTRGIALHSAAPVPLPETIWERGGSGSGSKADVLLGLLKWSVYAAVGVLGVASLYAVIRDVKGKATAA